MSRKRFIGKVSNFSVVKIKIIEKLEVVIIDSIIGKGGGAPRR